MANSLLENLSAAAALSGSDLFYVKQGGARGLKATGTQLLALVGTTYVPLAGGASMAGPLSIVNSTTQQIAYVYNTFTDASNYERLTLTGVAGTSVNITAETLGTGGDNLDIVLTPAGTGTTKITSGGLSLLGTNVIAIVGVTGTTRLQFGGSQVIINRPPSGTFYFGEDWDIGNYVFRGTGTLTVGRSVISSGANAQTISLLQISELTTIAAAATTDTTIQMPAGAIIFGVTCRVTTAITCTTNFNIGDSGSATRFGANISKAANTTNVGSVAPYLNASALSVRITPDTTPSDNTGRVRVTIYYFLMTAATS